MLGSACCVWCPHKRWQTVIIKIHWLVNQPTCMGWLANQHALITLYINNQLRLSTGESCTIFMIKIQAWVAFILFCVEQGLYLVVSLWHQLRYANTIFSYNEIRRYDIYLHCLGCMKPNHSRHCIQSHIAHTANCRDGRAMTLTLASNKLGHSS